MLKDQLLKLQEIQQGVGFLLLEWSRHSHTFNGQLSRSSSQLGMQGLVIKELGVNCSPGLGNHGNYALGGLALPCQLGPCWSRKVVSQVGQGADWWRGLRECSGLGLLLGIQDLGIGWVRKAVCDPS